MTGDATMPGTGGEEHGTHQHGGGAHGPDPLPGVSTTAMHATVDELLATLHEYVDTAAGVRAEFGSSEADEDPRVLALESRVAGLNARLYDQLHDALGMHSELTGLVWEDDEEPETVPGEDEDTDEFHLGFVVSLPSGPTDQSIDAVLGIVDNGGAEIVERLLDQGFAVEGWGTSRGAAVSFDEDDEDDDGPHR